jgi:hypothetical protein
MALNFISERHVTNLLTPKQTKKRFNVIWARKSKHNKTSQGHPFQSHFPRIHLLDYFASFIFSLQLHAKNKYIFITFQSYIMYVMHPCSLSHRIERKHFQNSGF